MGIRRESSREIGDRAQRPPIVSTTAHCVNDRPHELGPCGRCGRCSPLPLHPAPPVGRSVDSSADGSPAAADPSPVHSSPGVVRPAHPPAVQPAIVLRVLLALLERSTSLDSYASSFYGGVACDLRPQSRCALSLRLIRHEERAELCVFAVARDKLARDALRTCAGRPRAAALGGWLIITSMTGRDGFRGFSTTLRGGAFRALKQST